MMRIFAIFLACATQILATPACAEVPLVAEGQAVVAARTIRAQTILEPGDLVQVAADIPGALVDPSEGIGLEARVTLYAGRPVRSSDLGPPALVDRNQTVTLAYVAGPLIITAEGRALARGGEGDVIRAMNLASRTTVNGRIGANGVVQVGPQN